MKKNTTATSTVACAALIASHVFLSSDAALANQTIDVTSMTGSSPSMVGVIVFKYDGNPMQENANLLGFGAAVAIGTQDAVAGYFLDHNVNSTLLGVVAAGSASTLDMVDLNVPLGSSISSEIIRP
ncbi:hypothetical protein GS597_18395 [Synechococcales cyanobacterium C]|uniref:Uncharacterized protein n=1 Tax=Petrachloros mirabilis ULC683 TaxID=2781853 RepID=A0A8K2A2A6_9CYAN|nr:hypothetical protein [Petrachloros mirabilis]NCJ08441.1 hypothetical protein [Petrachloros mirabilis ULC683]